MKTSVKNRHRCAFAGTLVSVALLSGTALAAENPFATRASAQPYALAEAGTPEPNKGGHDMGMKAPEGNCGGMMKSMMDANKDGKISKEEFIKHHEHMFEMMDKDKNGVLDEAEMRQKGEMMKQMGGGMGGMGGMKHDPGQPGGAAPAAPAKPN